MGVLRFEDFVATVREPLCVLDVEPAYQHKHDEVARFMQPPYMAEIHRVNAAQVRLSISAHGELIRTVELPLTNDGAWICWNGIVAIFETSLE